MVRTMIDEDLPTTHVVEATKAENQLRMIQSATEWDEGLIRYVQSFKTIFLDLPNGQRIAK